MRLYFILLLTINITSNIYSNNLKLNQFSNEYIERRSNLPYLQILHRDLFHDYIPDVRPVHNDSLPTEVTVQFWLKQLLKVNERDQTIRLYLWLELYWKDEILTWNPTKYGNITEIHVPANKIWSPDLVVYNSANMNVEESDMEKNVVIKYDGNVVLFRSTITDITCNLNLADFPFDNQICYVTLASWSMDGSKIQLKAIDRNTNNSYLELYIQHSMWRMLGMKHKTFIKYYDCCVNPFPDITYFFVLQRSPSYYIFSLIIPSTFITVVTIIGFFTPHSTTGENTEKVSLGVTALLSMAIIMMMVSDEVPATSDVVPLIGKYYIGLIGLIFSAAFSTTVTLHFQLRANIGIRMSEQLRKLLFIKVARNRIFQFFFTLQMRKRSAREMKNNALLFGLHTANIMFNSHLIKTNLTQAFLKRDSLLEECHAEFTNREEQVWKLKEDVKLLEREDIFDIRMRKVFYKILNHISDISFIMKHEQEKRIIITEWQQAARILERLLMLFFLFATALFHIVMLTSPYNDIILTDELLEKIKK
uniref:Neur_chan_LBD domain-containing protein n=1 Tax=Strongyloides papillosus TaxID=174720 RepID=A0A0N5B6R1_STREA